ncbi:sigma-70 family RNA polymerase sigma factor [Rubinisphaera sp.]|uniref:RNA polymerase sigma factor n=1 Tax=Rubinisphaera sp. TaxID=2024857 RepID=UPI000C109F2F|nr:sigma-70 family RNA polymerase sigma factor [Rubinisphaera sp.]MBV09390.1 RNA polymerase subunit sigma-70 [Rubinisphaera sp.]HCS52283.1 sigma-70 family RNA polymerase sigma factor [Planctomycetaceae bacterium]|tara:strand:+ start:3839 stop:4444 length:606 start_codon:yes stop_codon:yes gene_type:complete
MSGQYDDSLATSLSLLQRVRTNDSLAWDRFAKLYSPLLHRWAIRFGLQDSDASDIAQDVLLSITTKIDRFDRSNSGQSLRAWMRTIVRNKCLDFARAKQRHAVVAGGADAQRMMSEVQALELVDLDCELEEAADESQVVLAAVEMLKNDFEDHTWQAFYQTAIAGRKASDVAADLGISVGSVYTAKSRVLSRLRTEFEGLL